MKNKIILSFLLSIIFLSFVNGFMPPTHRYLNEKLNSLNLQGNDLYDKCFYNEELCFAGNILTDFSLIYGYYTTEGASKYLVTHDSAFVQSALQLASNKEEEACAVGIALHSTTQDLQSHTKMVTNSIKKTGLPNSIIHTFSEQHLDNIVQDRSPGIKSRALNIEEWERCRPLFKKVVAGFDIYKGDVIDGTFDRNFDKFIDEVSGSITSYDLGFRKIGSVFDNLRAIPFKILAVYILSTLFSIISIFLLLFKKGKTWINWLTIIILLPIVIMMVWLFIANLQGNAFVTFVKFISPFSNIVPIGDPDIHLNTAITNGRSLFLEGERYFIGKDGSGFDELDEADKSVAFLDFVIIGVLFIGIVLLAWANLRRKKNREGFSL